MVRYGSFGLIFSSARHIVMGKRTNRKYKCNYSSIITTKRRIHFVSLNIRNNFFYTNQSILNNVGWKQLIIPYSWFKDENNSAAKLDLTRVVGIQIDITNTSKSSQQGTIHIDAIQQLTSYKPKLNHIPIFTSIFVQLYPDPNLNTNWQSDFTAYRQVGIDTVIVQFSVDGNRFNYTGSTISWKIQIILNMTS